MERHEAYVKLPHVAYPCPTCRKKHYHGYFQSEAQPYKRVSECPLEDGQVLIFLKKTHSIT
jgi:hypothetical protein